MDLTYDQIALMSEESLLWELQHSPFDFEVAQMIRDMHCEGFKTFTRPVLEQVERFVDFYQ
jgi:hypothetical protein